MKVKLLFTTVALIFFSMILGTPISAYGMTSLEKFMNSVSIGGTKDEEENEEKISELYEKIIEYQEKILELKGQEASLQRDIDYAQTQINLTNAKIQTVLADIKDKKEQIEFLSNEIDELSNSIKIIQERMDYQEKVLNERLRARYKIFNQTPFVILFGSTDLNTAVQKSQYLKIMQIQDKKLLDNMDATRNSFVQKKHLSEVKKEEVEELKAQIEIEKANLETYKADLKKQQEDKKQLLAKTENDERKYQALLLQVQSELAVIDFALNLPEGEGVEVKEGDVIGLMGNTGCSTGPHLHFGFVKNGKAVDPIPYLKNGDLRWPVDNWQITQYFGENYWFYMNNFGIPGHDAIDIISRSQWSGAPIKAARDGKLYYKQDSKVYCPSINNSFGRGAVIDHGDGEKTVYWHMQ